MATYDARPSGFTQLTLMSEWEALFQAAGIWDGVDTGLTPTLVQAGRTCNLAAGQCVIKGQLWSSDATYVANVPAAGTADRIDMLVLRLNRTAATSAAVVSPVILSGAQGSNPVPPAMSQTPTGNWDLPIAQWTSHANGNIDTMIDIRQFSGRGVVNMSSKYHPQPANWCTGYEIDTGNFFLWNPNTLVWAFIGGTNDQQIPDNSWNAMPLVNGWGAPAGGPVPSYKLGIRSGELLLAGELRQAGNPTSHQVCTLPLLYRPSNSQFLPVGFANATATSGYSPYMQIDPSGAVSVQGMTLPINPIVVFSGSVPMDLM